MEIYNEASDNEVLEFVKDSIPEPEYIKTEERADKVREPAALVKLL